MTTDSTTEAHPAPPPAGPITAHERLLTIDVLRGFAILGILWVNMQYFSAPLQLTMMDVEWWPSPIDKVATGLIHALAEGKFYMLFSLLFGIGMAIQMQRVEARGGRFVRLYVRRLLVLLAIGLLHAHLLWYGDILTLYALLGFSLLLFRKLQQRTLLILAVIFYLPSWLVITALVTLLELGRQFPEARAEIDASFAQQAKQVLAMAQRSAEAYGSGTLAEIFAQRLVDLNAMILPTLFIAPIVLAAFLTGLYVARRGIFQDPAAHERLLRRLVYWGLPIGLVCNVGYAVGVMIDGRASMTATFGLAHTLHTIGAPLLTLGYAAWIVRAMQTDRWRQRLSPVGAVGRMALTNYLLQTVVCTTIFYSYGLGLFNQVGPAAGLGLTVLIFAAQIPASVWWLSRFRFGPVEWLWRTLTYGRWQPMLRGAAT